MNLAELQRAMRQLRLGGMAAVLETRLHQAQAEPMAPIDLISCLVSDELTRRGDRLLERRRKQAGFRDAKMQPLVGPDSLPSVVLAIRTWAVSLSVIVAVAWRLLLSIDTCGLPLVIESSATTTVSLASTTASLSTGTVIVAVVAPAVIVTVPEGAV